MAGIPFLNDFCNQQSAVEFHLRTFPEPFGGTAQCFPKVVVTFVKQEDFRFAASVFSPAYQPGREYAGIVDHHDVGWCNKARQLGENSVMQFMVTGAEYKQPRPVAFGRRLLRDELFRECIVVSCKIHG